MIHQNLFQFLSELKKNNHKEWFYDQKPVYQIVRKQFEQLIAQAILDISSFDESVKYTDPKKCIFRINRDIRFSKDKSPYKTNFGAFIAPGGRNTGNAGYYIHLEPGNCFLAGGIYMPPPDRLKAVRNEIYENPEEFKKIIENKNFKKHFNGLLRDEMLKTAPKGFPRDFENIGLLKYKHYTVLKSISEEQVLSDSFANEIRETFKALYPLNNFINRGIRFQLENSR
ncbi:MAG: DUF2461 domain-containing protein [Bacteroidales bacterium]|jgi:uncharacterized protein (TIGR02453 family)|nr:DUF2461 domain-containing protein [Bacteroidales bacterium]